jgi:hypothetical protein
MMQLMPIPSDTYDCAVHLVLHKKNNTVAQNDHFFNLRHNFVQKIRLYKMTYAQKVHSLTHDHVLLRATAARAQKGHKSCKSNTSSAIFANAVTDTITGATLEYCDLMIGPNRQHWEQGWILLSFQSNQFFSSKITIRWLSSDSRLQI